MFISQQLASRSSPIVRLSQVVSARSMSTLGSGAGKGGGTGGSIRDAGGAMGKRQATQEEEYFRKKSAEMKEHLKKEIKKHEEAIEEHKKMLSNIEK